MNERALAALAILTVAASGTPPQQLASRLHGKVRELQARDPANAILATVLTATAAFYVAEREHNPKINSLEDALIYVSTNLSVGHSDILAKTTIGKVIGSALMTYGPALAARALDAPAAPNATAAANEALIAKLDEILVELKSARDG